jgi:hypothetical protein
MRGRMLEHVQSMRAQVSAEDVSSHRQLDEWEVTLGSCEDTNGMPVRRTYDGQHKE